MQRAAPILIGAALCIVVCMVSLDIERTEKEYRTRRVQQERDCRRDDQPFDHARTLPPLVNDNRRDDSLPLASES
jgi:hypothetical protein